MAENNKIAKNILTMDWNDTLESDTREFITLEEGDYNFSVIDFERGRFGGSAKIPACNKAILSLQVRTEDNKVANVKFDLLLYRPFEWRISSFFRCIGQKKKGEKLVMDWNKVIGSRGRAHFKPRTYINRDGEERQTNDIAYFYDYDPAYFIDEDEFVEIGDNDDVPY